MELNVFYWARKSYWTLEEAAQLCFGFEPLPVPEYEETIYSAELPHGVAPEVECIYELIDRAHAIGDLHCAMINSAIVVKPFLLLEWCYKNDLVFDEDLESEVLALSRKNNDKLPISEQREIEVEPSEQARAKSRSRTPENDDKARGRPGQYDWDLFHAEIIRIANTPDGLPDKRADLVRAMLLWFSERFGKEPSESAVKKKIIRIYSHLEEVKKSKN
ncbi:hypothetical protein [Roseibium sp.]|uniref:hypothetical protein n=1 Tax=Roseibium sp. TaxID=1936156 RepID=UPI003BAB7B48